MWILLVPPAPEPMRFVAYVYDPAVARTVALAIARERPQPPGAVANVQVLRDDGTQLAGYWYGGKPMPIGPDAAGLRR